MSDRQIERQKFSDKEYRDAYADTFLDTFIATQLRVLREQRDLTQRELADLAGMGQSRISTMEDVNYSSWSIKTLKRLAQAFDLTLIVKFESFGGLLREFDQFDRERLKRSSFAEDAYFKTPASGEGDDGAVPIETTSTGDPIARVASNVVPFVRRAAVIPETEVQPDNTSERVAVYG